jgi:hypothetical protein
MTPGKREREKARQEYQRAKEDRRRRRREEKDSTPRAPGEDPDIAGIVPGPQPVAEEDDWPGDQ